MSSVIIGQKSHWFNHCYMVQKENTRAVFYWDQQFQPQPVWVDRLTFLSRTLFLLFEIKTQFLLGIVLTGVTIIRHTCKTQMLFQPVLRPVERVD